MRLDSGDWNLRAEAAAFDPDHYMADFMEDAAVNTALDYTPWWRLVASEQLLERANGATAWGSSDERCEPHTSSLHGGATAAVTDAEASANADSWCCIGSAEQEQLLQLPPWSLTGVTAPVRAQLTLAAKPEISCTCWPR